MTYHTENSLSRKSSQLVDNERKGKWMDAKIKDWFTQNQVPLELQYDSALKINSVHANNIHSVWAKRIWPQDECLPVPQKKNYPRNPPYPRNPTILYSPAFQNARHWFASSKLKSQKLPEWPGLSIPIQCASKNSPGTALELKTGDIRKILLSESVRIWQFRHNCDKWG